VIYEDSIDYKYDEKKSPFIHCTTPKWFFWWRHNNMFGQNNRTEEKWKSGTTTTYEYVLDEDGYPTERTMNGNTSSKILYEYK
jgi:YD repeat-containing protein